MDTLNSTRSNFSRETFLLAIVICLGTCLRFWHITWGLPELTEEAIPLKHALKMWNWNGTGVDLNPHFFGLPALTFYVLFIIQGIQYYIGHLLGIFTSPQTFATSLATVVIPARIAIALFDIGTILLAYRFTKEYASHTIAFLAAVFIALNPLLIRQAHYITADTPLTFFAMLSLLFIYRVYTQSQPRWYILSGISIGLAAATNYSGAFLLIVLVAVHAMKSTSILTSLQSLKHPTLLKSIGCVFAVFFLINPHIILNFNEFVKDFAFQQPPGAEEHPGIDASQTTLGYYLLNVLPAGLGWGMFILLLATVALWIVKKERQHLVLLLFPAMYLAIISSWEIRTERYLLPAFPLVLIVCATGMHQAHEFVRARMKGAATVFSSALFVIVLAEPLFADYNFDRTIMLPDTRAAAKNWILRHLPVGSAIATGSFGIQLPEGSYRVLNMPTIASEPQHVAPFYDTRWYEDMDLLIASGDDYAQYAKQPQKFSEVLPFYDSLKIQWKLACEIKPSESQQGPSFWFYQPLDSFTHASFDSSLFSRFEGAEESTHVSMFLHDLSTILLQKKKWEKSEQLLENIVSVEESNYEARNMLARALFETGKYKVALVQLKKSMDIYPQQPSVVAFAGENLLRLGFDEEAEGTFLRALQMDNTLEPAYQDLIVFYTNRNDKAKLIDVLRRYLSVLPQGSQKADSIRQRIAQLKAAS